MYRRLNALLYLNKDWRPEYRGDLELWSEAPASVSGVMASPVPYAPHRCAAAWVSRQSVTSS